MTDKPADDDRETMEVRCPECKKRVKVSVAAVERGDPVRCPNGHDIPMMKAL